MEEQNAVEPLETDKEFGALIAEYDFRYERNKSLGLILLIIYGTIGSLIAFLIPYIGILCLLVMLWELRRCLQARAKISKRSSCYCREAITAVGAGKYDFAGK